jgi:excisionase family DNA binding protein
MTIRDRDKVLTTGEVARICHVAPRTVSKWFDTGRLRGYRIPGSRDRRIPMTQLIAFMKAHGMPLDGVENGVCRVLLVDGDAPPEVIGQVRRNGSYEVACVDGAFQAGARAEQMRPHVIILNTDDPDAAVIRRNIRQHPDLQTAKLIAVVDAGPDDAGRRLRDEGYDGWLVRPYGPAGLADEIDRVTDLVQ